MLYTQQYEPFQSVRHVAACSALYKTKIYQSYHQCYYYARSPKMRNLRDFIRAAKNRHLRFVDKVFYDGTKHAIKFYFDDGD